MYLIFRETCKSETIIILHLKRLPKTSPAQKIPEKNPDDLYGDDHADESGHVLFFRIIV